MQGHPDKPRLLVYGAGGHAKTVIDAIRRQGRYDPVGVVDDDLDKRDSELQGFRVLWGPEVLKEFLADGVRCLFVAIGDNSTRSRKTERLSQMGFEVVTVIDPAAIVLSGASIGPGTLLLPHSLTGVDATLGAGTIVSIGASVGHDCILGDYTQLAPGVRLAGNVHIGAESLLGLGATVIPGIDIGQRVTVGAGAAVVRDLPNEVVAAGVPAKILRRTRSTRGE